MMSEEDNEPTQGAADGAADEESGYIDEEVG